VVYFLTCSPGDVHGRLPWEQEINVATLILLRFQAQAAVAAWIAQLPTRGKIEGENTGRSQYPDWVADLPMPCNA
jgi:hypothetical protein